MGEEGELISQGDTLSFWVGKKAMKNIEYLGWQGWAHADIINTALEMATTLKEIQETKREDLNKQERALQREREFYDLDS